MDTLIQTITNPLVIGGISQILCMVLIVIILRTCSQTKFSQTMAYLIESMYDFFEDISGPSQKSVARYATNLFVIFLLMNLSGMFVDMFKLAFPGLEKVVTVPTGDIHFPAVVAIISIIYMIIKQTKVHGAKNTLLEYVPITGKGIIGEPGKQSIGSKIGDIALSLFIGLLDIIGIFAKMISLSARMFGNIFSGGILARVVVGGVSLITMKAFGVKFPLLLPIVLVAQSLLVGFIQAFVFPLLVTIFIRIATEDAS